MNSIKNKIKTYLRSEVVQWIIAILIFILLVLLLKIFFLEVAEVRGNSMRNTLEKGQVLIIFKTGYFFNPPACGDIVAIKTGNNNQTDYIKRVIAVPGDTIDLIEGDVYINGSKINEPYTKGKTFAREAIDFPVTIPEEKFFCLGDNREHSNDSRLLGLIDINQIQGKAVFRIWPLDKFGSIY